MLIFQGVLESSQVCFRRNWKCPVLRKHSWRFVQRCYEHSLAARTACPSAAVLKSNQGVHTESHPGCSERFLSISHIQIQPAHPNRAGEPVKQDPSKAQSDPAPHRGEIRKLGTESALKLRGKRQGVFTECRNSSSWC